MKSLYFLSLLFILTISLQLKNSEVNQLLLDVPSSFSLTLPFSSNLTKFEKIVFISPYFQSYSIKNGVMKKRAIDREAVECHFKSQFGIISLCHGKLSGNLVHDGKEFQISFINGGYHLELVDVEKRALMKKECNKEGRVRQKRDLMQSVGDRFVEIVVVNDLAAFQLQGSSASATESWATGIFASARDMYINGANDNLDFPIFLELGAVITIEDSDPWPKSLSGNIVDQSLMLDAFRDYSVENKFWGFDAAMLISGHTFQGSGIGLAQSNSFCTNDAVGTVSTDAGSDLFIASTFAHEVGHILDLDHDGSVGCAASGFVMESTGTEVAPITFSTCSITRLNEVFGTTNSLCFDNDPSIPGECEGAPLGTACTDGGCDGIRNCVSRYTQCKRLELEYGDTGYDVCPSHDESTVGGGDDWCSRIYCLWEEDGDCYTFNDDNDNDLAVEDGVPCPGENHFCVSGVCTEIIPACAGEVNWTSCGTNRVCIEEICVSGVFDCAGIPDGIPCPGDGFTCKSDECSAPVADECAALDDGTSCSGSNHQCLSGVCTEIIPENICEGAPLGTVCQNGGCDGNGQCVSRGTQCDALEIEYGDTGYSPCGAHAENTVNEGKDWCSEIYCLWAEDNECYFFEEEDTSRVKVADGVPCPGQNSFCVAGVCTKFETLDSSSTEEDSGSNTEADPTVHSIESDSEETIQNGDDDDDDDDNVTGSNTFILTSSIMAFIVAIQ